jgi:predicted nucleic acid-binding protein
VILVDTTVLIYAVGSDHAYREPCRDIISAVSSRRLEATTTVEVIQEFAHVRARSRGRTDARRLATDYADLFAPLATSTETHLRSGLDTWARHPSLGAFDAVLAAVADALGADVLVSSDRAFAATPINHLLPTPENVRGLLGERL